MFSRLIKNRRGSITIMISVILIAVLSLSSTLIEIARYRSLERIFREVEENAAFSVLSHYDRDLFKNFGLLAVSQDVGKDELVKYMEKNLSGISETQKNGIDSLLTLADVDFDKLYDLAQDDVLRGQIMEFAAFRAPATLIDNALNMEELVKGLVKELEKCLPMLNLFQNILNVIDSAVNAILEIQKLGDAGKNLKDSNNEYEKALEEYNKAVTDRDEYQNANSSSEEEEDEDAQVQQKESEEEYQANLRKKNDDVAAAAAALRSNLADVKEKLGDYWKRYESFLGAFDGLSSAGITAKIETSKGKYEKAALETDEYGNQTANAKSAENIVKSVNQLNDGINRTKSQCGKISDCMKAIHENDIIRSQERLSAQMELLNQKPEQLGKMETAHIDGTGGLWVAVDIVVKALEFVAEIVKAIIEGIKSVTECLEIFELLFPALSERTLCNNVIGENELQSLAGHLNNGAMRSVENKFALQDQKEVQLQISRAQEVADKVEFNTNSLQIGNGPGENYGLQNAIDAHYQAIQRLMDVCEDMTSWSLLQLFPLTLIANVLRAIAAGIEYVFSCINLCNYLIRAWADGSLTKIIYQRLYIASYASGMFSNFATDLTGDKRMNGSSFPDFRTASIENDCFDMANAEYIFNGSSAEAENLYDVLQWMLIIRTFCNLPAVLTNQTVMDIVSPLFAGGITVVFGIIVILLFMVLEGLVDVFFLQHGETVPIIKIDGYLKAEDGNLQELKKKLRGMLKSNDKAKEMLKLKEDENGSKENSPGKTPLEKNVDECVEKWGRSLIEWDYQDHLLFMLLVSKSSDQMLARCADLIDLQMKKMKKENGDFEKFELQKMATFIRVDAKAAFRPVLPIPIVPGIQDGTLKTEVLHYSGY